MKINYDAKMVFSCFALLLFSACASSGPTKDEKIAELYMRSGTNDLMSGNYTIALQSLLKSASLNPKPVEVWNNLGLAYLGKKDYKRAEESFHKALSINKEFNQARNNLGALYLEENKLKSAEKEFEIVLKDPSFPELYRVYYNMGIIQYKLRNFLKARDLFQSSLKENSNFCVAWLKISECDLQIMAKDSAVDALRSASTGLCYGFSEAHYQLGMLYSKMNNLALAKEKFSEVVERFPESSWAKLAQDKLRWISQK